MSKPSVSSLAAVVEAQAAQIAVLEQRIAALESVKSQPAPQPAVKSRPNPSIVLADLASAIADGSAMQHIDRSSLAFSVRGARWRLADLDGMSPAAMGGRVRAHCLAGRKLNPAKWERVR